MAKLTLHEKATVGKQAVLYLKNCAAKLRREAEQFDCKWPLSIAKDMEVMSEYYLKQLK